MATGRSVGMVVGLAVGALVASIVAISIVRNHDDDHGRFPDQVVAAPATPGVSHRADATWTLDGSTLYVAGETGIDILSGSPLARTGRLESRLFRPDATWSPDRSMVVLSSNAEGDEAEVWDLSEGRLLPDVSPGRTSAQPAWSPDGRYLVTSDLDGLVVVRDSRSGQVSSSFTVFEPGGSVLGISWPTPDRIVTVSISRIVAVDASTGETIWSHASGPSGLVVSSPDGADVVIGQGLSHRHDVYALGDGVVLGDVEIDSRTLLAIDWSPDGRWFVASGDDDRPRLWDATAAVTRDEYPAVAPYKAGAAWAPNSRFVALADSYDHRLMILDMTGVIDTEELSISEDEVLVAAAWAPAGQRLAAIGRNGTVFVWNVPA